MLHLFQCLPVKIPPKQFSEWDRLISRYIWQGKKARIKYKTLQLRKEKDGMGLSCLQEYYYSAQLRPLICLCSPIYTASWKDVEGTTVKNIPIPALLADSKLQGELLVTDDPMQDILLKSWQEIVKTCRVGESSKLLKWFAYDSDFAPN